MCPAVPPSFALVAAVALRRHSAGSLFLLDWVLTLWCKALPPTLACWAWDNLLARGFGSAGCGCGRRGRAAATGTSGGSDGGAGEEWGLWLSAALLVALRPALLAATALEQAAALLRATSVAALFGKGCADHLSPTARKLAAASYLLLQWRVCDDSTVF